MCGKTITTKPNLKKCSHRESGKFSIIKEPREFKKIGANNFELAVEKFDDHLRNLHKRLFIILWKWEIMSDKGILFAGRE